MKLMKPEQLVQYFVLCVFFSLFLGACTDAAAPVVLQETEAGAELPDNLPVCTWEHEGEVSLLPNDNQTYRCEGGDWHPYNVYNGIEAGNETEWSSASNNENLWDDYSFASSSSVMILISSSDVVSSSSVQTILRISSSSVKSSSSAGAIQGSFVDSRDGTRYKTITVGGQTWMAENLKYEQKPYGSDRCYKENPGSQFDEGENCSLYGRYYHEVIFAPCPDGWHLPDTTEWKILLANVGGVDKAAKNLKSADGWNGSDAYGFNALPAGLDSIFTGHADEFKDVGHYAYFMTSSVNHVYPKNCTYTVLLGGNDNVDGWTCRHEEDRCDLLYSVRCLKD